KIESQRRGEEPKPREYTQCHAWKGRLENPREGHATIVAIKPVMEDWLGCHHRSKYLCRVGRVQSPGCHHCEDYLEDTAQHTLERRSEKEAAERDRERKSALPPRRRRTRRQRAINDLNELQGCGL
ncbi:jg15201, partial [Pararge aegeria aegeria]